MIDATQPVLWNIIGYRQGGTMKKQESQCNAGKSCGTVPNVSNKENCMKSGVRDKAEGVLHEVKGAIIEAAGKLTDNPKLEVEGTVEKIAGKVQSKIGQVKQVFGK
jgi:uncharacterized protein YjbJ (UPF0337 family)